MLSGVATVIILVVGGQRAIEGGLTIGALTAFIGYINRFFSPVRTLSERYNSLQSATVAAERIFEVLDEDLEIVDKPGGLRAAADRRRGRFRRRHLRLYRSPGDQRSRT